LLRKETSVPARTETKEEIAAERDRLRAENENLRGQLTASGVTRTAGTAAPAAHTFQLSEGDRQELATTGLVNVGGRAMTRDEVRAALGKDQQNIDLGTAEPTYVPPAGRSTGVEGVDYIYPSVSPGFIDPNVAGTPGISGPAATGTPPPAAASADNATDED
jgi:hypothetical protein